MRFVESTFPLDFPVYLDCKDEVVHLLLLDYMKEGQLVDADGTGLEGSMGSPVGKTADPLDRVGRPAVRAE